MSNNPHPTPVLILGDEETCVVKSVLRDVAESGGFEVVTWLDFPVGAANLLPLPALPGVEQALVTVALRGADVWLPWPEDLGSGANLALLAFAVEECGGRLLLGAKLEAWSHANSSSQKHVVDLLSIARDLRSIGHAAGAATLLTAEAEAAANAPFGGLHVTSTKIDQIYGGTDDTRDNLPNPNLPFVQRREGLTKYATREYGLGRSQREIARALNAAGHTTVSGRPWTQALVSRLISTHGHAQQARTS